MEDNKKNFIIEEIEKDIKENNVKEIITRFPPEPNGYLHIGHAKAILLNYKIAKKYKGKFNLRFDDTNPEKEDIKFINAIKEDLTWLGVDWEGEALHTSDYFEDLYNYALELINKGKAYCCDLSVEDNRTMRGTLTEAATPSPNRDRSIEENLEIFKKMKEGFYNNGEMSLKAKIDLSHPNLCMRDPVIYRVKKVKHPVTGDSWCIYPMYDFAHCLSDALENITHSLCSLEFMNNRCLYEWFIENLSVEGKPRQIEFSKLKIENFIMGKRHLRTLVETGAVEGWDDPRMPTLSGMRRRGYPKEAIHDFIEDVGVTKKDSTVSLDLLEHHVRNHLIEKDRVFSVVDPIKVTITNWDKDAVKEIEAKFNPKDENSKSRKIPFTREIYIEGKDFMEEPPKKYYRLSLGKKVRLKYGYVITCNKVIKDEEGKVIELECTYDERTIGGVTPEGEKRVKGIINWVSATDSIEITTKLYSPISKEKEVGILTGNPVDDFDKESLVVKKSYLERSLKDVEEGVVLHFERNGWFKLDNKERMEFIRVIEMKKNNWNKKK